MAALWFEGDAFGAFDECGVVESAEVVAEFLLPCFLQGVEDLVGVDVVESAEFHGVAVFCSFELF